MFLSLDCDANQCSVKSNDTLLSKRPSAHDTDKAITDGQSPIAMDEFKLVHSDRLSTAS